MHFHHPRVKGRKITEFFTTVRRCTSFALFFKSKTFSELIYNYLDTRLTPKTLNSEKISGSHIFQMISF